MHTELWWEDVNGKDDMGNLGIDVKVILKLVLLKSIKIHLPKHMAGHWKVVL